MLQGAASRSGCVVVVLLTAIACGGDDLIGPDGTIQVVTATTGPDPDPNGYAVTIDDATSALAIGTNTTLTVPASPPERTG